MNEKKLQQYAELLVKQGIRVLKGEEVWVYASVQNHEFATLVVEECYKAGAKKVVVDWSCEGTDRLAYKHMKLADLGKVAPYTIAKWKYTQL